MSVTRFPNAISDPSHPIGGGVVKAGTWSDYENPEIEKLFAQTEGLADRDARDRAFARITRILHDDAQTVPITELFIVFAKDRGSRPQRVAWTKRIARLYEEQLEDLRQRAALVRQGVPGGADRASEPGAAAATGRQAGSLAGRGEPARRATSPASWATSRRSGHRAPHRGDLRPAPRTTGRGARSTTAGCSTRAPDDREVAQLFEEALERWERLAGAARADRRGGGRAVDPAAKLTLLRRSAKLDEEKLDSRGRAIGTLREAIELDPQPTAARPPSSNGCCAPRTSGTSCPSTWRRRWSASRDRRERDAIRCGWPDVLEKRVDDRRARSIATRRSWSARPGTARRSRRWSAGRRDPDAAPRGRDPRAGLPEVPATAEAGRRARRAARHRRRPRPTACRSCARWPRSTSASARLDLAFDCRSRAWLADVEFGRNAGRDGDAGLVGAPLRPAGRDAAEGRRRGDRSGSAVAPVGR